MLNYSDYLMDIYSYDEFKDRFNGDNADLRDGLKVRLMHGITEVLTEKEKFYVDQIIFKKKTVRGLARDLGVYPGTVSRGFRSARQKLKKYIKFYYYLEND